MVNPCCILIGQSNVANNRRGRPVLGGNEMTPGAGVPWRVRLSGLLRRTVLRACNVWESGSDRCHKLLGAKVRGCRIPENCEVVIRVEMRSRLLEF